MGEIKVNLLWLELFDLKGKLGKGWWGSLHMVIKQG